MLCSPISNLFAVGIAAIASAAVISSQSSFISYYPTPTSSAIDATNSSVACDLSTLKIENNSPQNISIKVYYDNAGWNYWNWTNHDGGIQVPQSHVEVYQPGDRYNLDGVFASGSWYIVQANVTGGSCRGTGIGFAQYRFYNGACDVLHFGDENDCQFHSR